MSGVKEISSFKKILKPFLILFGIADSVYLLLSDLLSDFCTSFSCTALIYEGINIPAVLGLGWFSGYPALRGRILSIWQLLAVSGIIILSCYALVTSYYCPFCFAAYTAGILLIAMDRTNWIKLP
ncbi:MAG: hypothetical protein ACOC5L_04175, partial [Halobacteriota archaeon]